MHADGDLIADGYGDTLSIASQEGNMRGSATSPTCMELEKCEAPRLAQLAWN